MFSACSACGLGAPEWLDPLRLVPVCDSACFNALEVTWQNHKKRIESSGSGATVLTGTTLFHATPNATFGALELRDYSYYSINTRHPFRVLMEHMVKYVEKQTRRAHYLRNRAWHPVIFEYEARQSIPGAMQRSGDGAGSEVRIAFGFEEMGNYLTHRRTFPLDAKYLADLGEVEYFEALTEVYDPPTGEWKLGPELTGSPQSIEALYAVLDQIHGFAPNLYEGDTISLYTAMRQALERNLPSSSLAMTIAAHTSAFAHQVQKQQTYLIYSESERHTFAEPVIITKPGAEKKIVDELKLLFIARVDKFEGSPNPFASLVVAETDAIFWSVLGVAPLVEDLAKGRALADAFLVVVAHELLRQKAKRWPANRKGYLWLPGEYENASLYPALHATLVDNPIITVIWLRDPGTRERKTTRQEEDEDEEEEDDDDEDSPPVKKGRYSKD